MERSCNKRTLVVSDFHFTLQHQDKKERQWVRKLKRIVHTKEIERIIILGDLYDYSCVGKWDEVQQAHPSFFSFINEFPDVVCVSGNNDKEIHKLEGLILRYDGRWPIALVHGHQFTPNLTFLKKIFKIQRKEPEYNFKLSEKLIKFAEKHKCRLIIGHTHIPDEQCNYYNCGAFPETMSYIVINEYGDITLYDKR